LHPVHDIGWLEETNLVGELREQAARFWRWF